MQQTLFHVPLELWGLPLFGVGILLGVWALFSAVFLCWQYLRTGWSQELLNALVMSGVLAAVVVWGLPKLAESDGIPIRGYGVMMLIAVTCSIGLAVHRARQVGLSDEVVYSLAMWMVFPGILGARLFYVIEYRDEFFKAEMPLAESLRKAIAMHEGGLVVFGALLGALPGLVAFAYKYKMPTMLLLDLAAPSMALGQALGRIGCFMNGCCFGGVCELPWGVTFPENSPPYVQELQNGQLIPGGLSWSYDKSTAKLKLGSVVADSPAAAAGLRAGDTIEQITLVDADGRVLQRLPSARRDGGILELKPDEIGAMLMGAQPNMTLVAIVGGRDTPVRLPIDAKPSQSLSIHPTQIYSSIDAFLLCGILLCWIPFRRYHGELIALTMGIHAISRFLLEIIRTDEAGQFGTDLSISQWISIGMLAAGAAIYAWVSRQAKLRVMRAAI